MVFVHMGHDVVFGGSELFETVRVEQQVGGVDPVNDAEPGDDMRAFHRHFVKVEIGEAGEHFAFRMTRGVSGDQAGIFGSGYGAQHRHPRARQRAVESRGTVEKKRGPVVARQIGGVFGQVRYQEQRFGGVIAGGHHKRAVRPCPVRQSGRQNRAVAGADQAAGQQFRGGFGGVFGFGHVIGSVARRSTSLEVVGIMPHFRPNSCVNI